MTVPRPIPRIQRCDFIMGGEGRVFDKPVLADAPNADEVFLLVHGFCVSFADAAESLGGFRTMLGEANPALRSRIRTAAWGGKLAFGPFAYRGSLRNALDSADHLVAQLLHWFAPPQGAPHPKRLIIFAHSMGCRLVLEALEKLRILGRPRGLHRLELVLMAPAVPEGLLRRGGGLEATTAVADTVTVMHSFFDGVLAAAFPIGQLRAGEGWLGEAVGWRGKPFPEKKRRDMGRFYYGHGSYWKNRRTIEAIRSSLKLPIPAEARAPLLAAELRLALGTTRSELPLM